MVEDFIQVQPDSIGKKLRAIKQTVAGNDVESEVVVLSSDGSNTLDPTSWADKIVTQNITAASQSVIIQVSGRTGLGFQVIGAWTGNLTVLKSQDNGATYITALTAFDIGSDLWKATDSGTTGNVNWCFPVDAGITHFKVLSGGAWTGTAAVTLIASYSVRFSTEETIGRVGNPAPARAMQIGGYSAGNLQIPYVIASTPGGTEYGFVTRNIPSGTQTSDDIDRATRLLGVIYGSQGQQLKQTATNFNAQVELATGPTLYDARSIRALTSADIVSAAQGTAAGLSGKWPVQITDGTNTMPTLDAAARAGFIRNLLGNKSTYAVTTGVLTGATAAGKKQLLVIWHPSTVTKRYQLLRLDVSTRSGSAGSNMIELVRGTTTAPSGGTAITPEVLDQADAASGATVQSLPTTAPTLATVPAIQIDAPIANNLQFTNLFGESAALEGKPPILRASVAEGWAVVQDVDAAITTAPKFIITIWWSEE